MPDILLMFVCFGLFFLTLFMFLEKGGLCGFLSSLVLIFCVSWFTYSQQMKDTTPILSEGIYEFLTAESVEGNRVDFIIHDNTFYNLNRKFQCNLSKDDRIKTTIRNPWVLGVYIVDRKPIIEIDKGSMK